MIKQSTNAIARISATTFIAKGEVSMNKPELIKACKQYKFLEKEVPKVYVERSSNKNSNHYAKIDTSCIRDVGAILSDLKALLLRTDTTTSKTQMLVEQAHQLL